jgi:hypothetical protein
MISFWVTRDGSFGIRTYGQNRGRAIAGRFQTRLYDDIGEVTELSAGTQVFAAVDQLTAPQREIVAVLWEAHARAVPGAVRLNDPRRVLRRFDLLTELHARGINSYRVFAATAAGEVRGFPVFVRERDSHDGPLTGLLHTRDDLAAALSALRVRGYRPGVLMITEFCDTAGADGVFRKYAAFKVGDRILAAHVHVSRSWNVKSASHELDAARVAEGMRFVETNPHEAWLRDVFAVANVGYGRADYGVRDGVPQVWEINLNPTLGRAPGARPERRVDPGLAELAARSRDGFHERLREAFVAIDGADGDRTAPVRVTIDEGLLRRLRDEKAVEHRRRRVLRWLQDLYVHPALGPPIRALYSRLFPRR